MERSICALDWNEGQLRFLDQTRLPHEVVYMQVSQYRDVVTAIHNMQIRGAPVIGVAAAYGMALAARETLPSDCLSILRSVEESGAQLRAARPTAVNLSWAIDRLLLVARNYYQMAGEDAQVFAKEILTEAQRIHEEDLEATTRIGILGTQLLPPKSLVVTHCNTGALATTGKGTALGIIQAGWDRGLVDKVFVTESRPLFQGARLTSWELLQLGIPMKLIVDSALGYLLRTESINCIIVGADRIAANGDIANKIGTYSLAILAREHGVPFYVAAPISTIDMETSSGDAIVVEERNPAEVLRVGATMIAPDETPVWNPAFDITPSHYVTALITEAGILKAPSREGLAEITRTRVRSNYNQTMEPS